MIEIKNFSFFYPGTSSPALEDISLTVTGGETVLIVGPSGCGKSTLLLTMNGVVPSLTGGKVKGRVLVDGRDTRETAVAELAADVGLILQDPESQLTNLYVYDEVAFGPENLGLPDEEIIKRSDKALQTSGLFDLKNRSVFALSGGQKQRVAIAASLAMEPKIILLDNPTSNLDPVGAAETYRAIRELRQGDSEKIIILADHRPDHMMTIVDRVIVMESGRIIADGSPKEVYQSRGDALKDELGIFLPQVVDLFLQMQKEGYTFRSMPLDLGDGISEMLSINLRIRKDQEVKVPSKFDQTNEANRILELNDVHFSYSNQGNAVDGVSLDVHKGEFLCLVGQNGSGKTTLAKLMVGLLKTTIGSIRFFGEDISQIPLQSLIGRVGYVFQYPEHQFVANQVFDEIAFSLRALKVPENEVVQQTEKMLSLFDLEHVREASPLFLSKGQKRRLSVATMLITRPEVLILDEPMTGQDQKNIINLLSILNDLRHSGTTIIDITHDMEHVASYADRVIGMANGKNIFDGAPKDLFTDSDTLAKLFLEPPPIVTIAEALREKGYPIPKEVNTIDTMIRTITEGEGR